MSCRISTSRKGSLSLVAVIPVMGDCACLVLWDRAGGTYLSSSEPVVTVAAKIAELWTDVCATLAVLGEC